MGVTFRGSLQSFQQRSKAALLICRNLPGLHARKIITIARGRWPVKTGKSKASLRVEEPRPGMVALIADARTPKGKVYTVHIQSGGIEPWWDLVVAPAEQLVRDLPALVGHAIETNLRVR